MFINATIAAEPVWNLLNDSTLAGRPKRQLQHCPSSHLRCFLSSFLFFRANLIQVIMFHLYLKSGKTEKFFRLREDILEMLDTRWHDLCPSKPSKYPFGLQHF